MEGEEADNMAKKETGSELFLGEDLNNIIFMNGHISSATMDNNGKVMVEAKVPKKKDMSSRREDMVEANGDMDKNHRRKDKEDMAKISKWPTMVAAHGQSKYTNAIHTTVSSPNDS
jgi:hypothetical protein